MTGKLLEPGLGGARWYLSTAVDDAGSWASSRISGSSGASSALARALSSALARALLPVALTTTRG